MAAVFAAASATAAGLAAAIAAVQRAADLDDAAGPGLDATAVVVVLWGADIRWSRRRRNVEQSVPAGALVVPDTADYDDDDRSTPATTSRTTTTGSGFRRFFMLADLSTFFCQIVNLFLFADFS